MAPESQLESTEHGLVPMGEGWFVLNGDHLGCDRFAVDCVGKRRSPDREDQPSGDGAHVLLEV